MALVFTPEADPIFGNKIHSLGSLQSKHGLVAFDSSYPTGGEPIDKTIVGADGQLVDIILPNPVSEQGNRLARWDKANSKILLYTALGTEATNASDQSSITLRIIALIRSGV